ncbi:sensor histidine kinase [Dermatophilus congolensis]|uniref:histidine kinase n=1 Tax=Dermatophilus congolensis TaxID=1863 RepID=A0A239V4C6_9MICO|nr:HAMP domain-containing sensor histidine kinase [Dermatophilus congolensis]MBO3130202.1 HAMP domain-containing histidine kinase [Dermatophilus congolensis]MBO3131171.1 HAMP domain-containing histidine kinase [Dermatophilus congolensis]MBO3134673.1 HAMP domain-containing histidine kinase [Dermatophilus congolensis]MBO3136910.1 HAMP domain-containing histidine kinase [Dermatophilus congolensis]MBO3139154.1 HAMP domain-containing histidine kinase [Dermatophilus congolensis]
MDVVGAVIAGAALIVGVAVGRLWKPRRHLHPELPEHQVLAHEIRTPLSLVEGATELLAETLDTEQLTPQQRKLLDTIRTNSVRAIGVAATFLVSARMRSDDFRPDLQPCDVRLLLRETAQELRETSAIPIVVDDQGDPLHVHADPVLLRHALWNVINNAARYAAETSDIRVHARAGENNVVITVADLGPGMSRQRCRSVFVPFEQYEPRAGLLSGAGLGMSITRDIVNVHGGRLLVDSIAHHGTSVLLTLPRSRA